jgi:hypothetical protein
MVSAYTLTNINEAIGVARAARAYSIPCAISFTVETDGRLVTGKTLREAIETVDQETAGYPVYYLINCAHPTHLESALAAGEAWTRRILGVKANASAKSHAELDESETLDAGDPADLGRRYRLLTRSFPTMRILGGCCGTDHRHVAAICEACVPPFALSACASHQPSHPGDFVFRRKRESDMKLRRARRRLAILLDLRQMQGRQEAHPGRIHMPCETTPARLCEDREWRPNRPSRQAPAAASCRRPSGHSETVGHLSRPVPG